MKINWNFLGGGGGAKQKFFHGGSMGGVWNCTMPKCLLFIEYVFKDTNQRNQSVNIPSYIAVYIAKYGLLREPIRMLLLPEEFNHIYYFTSVAKEFNSVSLETTNQFLARSGLETGPYRFQVWHSIPFSHTLPPAKCLL